VPGRYTVVLTTGGRSYTQPLVVTLDPRVTVSALGLEQQHALGKRIVSGLDRSYARYRSALTRHDPKIAARYAGINSGLARLLDLTQGVDAAPTAVQRAAADSLLGAAIGRSGDGAFFPAADEP